MFLLISNLRVRNDCFFSCLTFGLEYDVRGTSPLWWECMAFVERRPSSANLGGAYDVRGTSPPKFVRVRRFWFDSGFLATSGHELTQNRARTEANTSVQGNLEVMGGEHVRLAPPAWGGIIIPGRDRPRPHGNQKHVG